MQRLKFKLIKFLYVISKYNKASVTECIKLDQEKVASFKDKCLRIVNEYPRLNIDKEMRTGPLSEKIYTYRLEQLHMLIRNKINNKMQLNREIWTELIVVILKKDFETKVNNYFLN